MAAAPLPLTDDLWLTAHDGIGGKPRLTPRTLGIGLGAGLLAELLFWRNLELDRGRLHLLSDTPPNDPALVPVLNQFLEEERTNRRAYLGTERNGQHITDWIAYLAAGRAEQLVINRLAQAGHITRQERRGLTGKKVYFVPADSNIAGWPASRIRTMLERGQQLDHSDLALAGLFLATALNQQALEQLGPEGLRELSRQLKNDLHPMLRELVSHAEAAVGEAVMNR